MQLEKVECPPQCAQRDTFADPVQIRRGSMTFLRRRCHGSLYKDLGCGQKFHKLIGSRLIRELAPGFRNNR